MSNFFRDFKEMYTECIPVKLVKSLYKQRKPWLTEGLIKSIKRKNKLYRNRKNNLSKYKTETD